MGRPVAAIVSFRLGGSDGVSIEAAKWAGALQELGFDVATVAGEGRATRILPQLAMGASEAPSRGEVEDSLVDADLVVVENLCSLPLNPAAGSVVAGVLHGRRAILHHHDLPWQRNLFSGFPPPPDDPSWAHVAINEISRHELASRGIDATVVRNTFDVKAPAGERMLTRAAMEVPENERLVLQPTRAIPRKNVAGGIALSEALGATFWLLGAAENGFGPRLDELLSQARCRVLTGDGPHRRQILIEDAYAACDVVALPLTWEGFGNPAIESAVHRRPLAIGHYPVAAELAAFGFRWFAAGDAGPIDRWLEHPDASLLEHNHAVAAKYFSIGDLPARIGRVIERSGWTKW